MNWFEKLIPPKIKSSSAKKGVPQGVWSKCAKCDSVLYNAELERNQKVCPRCGHHMRIGARKRLEWLLDEQSIEEIAADIKPVDMLKFVTVRNTRTGYPKRKRNQGIRCPCCGSRRN